MAPIASSSDDRPNIFGPSELFAQMDAAEQDKAFTKAGAEAIRLGANIGQVVNSRRGMRQASVFGRDVLITTEGTTKRGFAGKRLMNQGAKTRREEAGLAIRQTANGPELRRVHQTRVITPRLMPEAIVQAAKGDRDEAIRLLHRFGFIL